MWRMFVQKFVTVLMHEVVLHVWSDGSSEAISIVA
jgi:hypothetical protein